MSKRDALWASIVKVIGWVIVFPWLIATPLLGVYLYQVVESVTPDDQLESIKLGFALRTILRNFLSAYSSLYLQLVNDMCTSFGTRTRRLLVLVLEFINSLTLSNPLKASGNRLFLHWCRTVGSTRYRRARFL